MKTTSLNRMQAISIALLLVMFVFPAMVQGQSWYNASWLYRKAITIDYTKVGTGPHTNFPVLISRADADLQTKAQTDGDDILFTSSDGTTKLAHEIESYSSASGTLIAWVKIPSLSSSANTVIYMYYGNAAATSQQNVTGTWDASFKGVYHLNNAFSDATSNAYNGTNTGTTDVTGKISQGRGFVRSNGIDYISITGLMGSPANVTISSWATLTTRDPSGAQIINIGDHTGLDFDDSNLGGLGYAYYNPDWNRTNSSIHYAGTGWHYVSYTFDDAGNVQKYYVDGVQVASSAFTASINYTGLGTNTRIGSHANGGAGFDFDGSIDEVRVAGSARSAGWILTEYNNQNSPSAFYNVSPEACQSNISQIPTLNLILNYKFNGNANSETGANNGTLQNSPAQTADRFGITNKAYTFNGTSQYVSSSNSYYDPGNFSISVWFKTATTSGGLLMGFGSAQTGLSGNHDRKIYMNNSGQIYFGVYTGTTVMVNSPLSYNDNEWHLATATLSGTTGMVLYIDGAQVDTDPTNYAAGASGYWRIGFDNLSGWPSTHTSNYFNGTLDDALVYHTALNSTQVAVLYNSPDGAGNNGPVCAGSSLNLTATTVSGAAYAWTGPNGFTSSSQNPTLTYSSAYAGVYTVQVTAGGCTTTAYTKVSTAATSSVISYAGSPYCKTAGTASVTFAGTTGGTYSSTAGLSINATTGAVTLSTSTAGTYTVTYTVAGGCTATTSITVNAVPTTSAAGADQTSSATCGLTIVTLAANAPAIGTGAWSIISGTGGIVTTPTSATSTFTGTAGTTYTLRWTISNSPCTASTDDVVITFNRNPTTAAAGADQTSAATCGLTTVTLAANAPAIGTGAWSIISGTGGTVTAPTSATSTFTGTAGTTYTLRWTISNTPCTASTDDVVITFNYIGNNLVDYINGAHGVICNTITEGGSVTLTAPAGTVFINVAFASYGSPAGTCSAFTIGTCHAATSQAVAESYLLGNNTGTIVVNNTVFGDPCNGTPKRFYVQAIYTQPICSGTAPGTITGTTPTGGNAVFTYLWEQSITSATTGFSAAGGTNNAKDYTPGILTQTTWYRRTVISGGCTNLSAVIQITVTPLPAATISYTGSPYCSNAGTAAVTRTGTTTGTYSSTAGLTINAGTGDITLASSTAGTYTVTYTMAATGGCTVQTATASVTITTLPAATISYSGSPFCKSIVTAQPVILTGTAGGTFTSTAGLTINASTGAVTPNTSTAGTYTVTYTMAAGGGCTAQTATSNVTITDLPAATISYSGAPFCTSLGTAQAVTQTGTTGGTYSSLSALTLNTSTGAITPSTSTPGTYTVTYTMVAGVGCVAQTTTTSVTITALPAATISYSGSPFCKSVATTQTVTLTGTTGGTYTSTAGLTINASTGAITPSTSTAGIYTVTYTMAAAGGCAAQTATTSVTITTLPAATISYSGSPFCNSVATAQSVTQTGTAGGTYSSTAGLTINASTGSITPNTSTAGTYTVTYTMAATGGCAAQTATTSVTITALPAATISYSGSPFCSNVGTGSVTLSGTSGGTFSSTAGLTINAATGAVTPATSTAGTYTITYTIAAAGGCSAQTATTSVTVTTLPSATISYPGSPFCTSVGTAQPVTQTGTTGGVYSSTAGLSIDVSTGAIIPGTSTAGTYTVTYTMAATGGCSVQTATTSITITAIPAATISYPGSPYMINAGTAAVTFSGTTGGTYSSTAGLSLNATTGDVTLSTSTPGIYTVTYTVAAVGGCSVFSTTASITVVIATKTFTGTGNFSDPLRWTGGTLPTVGENLVIDGTCTVDNNAGTDNIAYGTLIIGTATARALNWIAGGTNRLNVSNVSAGSVASALNMTNGGTLIIRGTWASTNLTFTAGAGTIELQSTITLPVAYTTYRNLIVNGSGTTVKLGVATTLNGNLTITAGTLSSNNFNLTMKGNWLNNVSTTAFTAGTATVTFTGTTAQLIGGTFATTFTNLTTGNTLSGVTLNTNVSVTGNLSVTVGTFDLGAFTANRATAGGTLSLSNNTILKIGGTNTFPTNFTTNTLGLSSTVEYYGTNQTVAAKTYGNLTLSSASGAAVKTFAATAFAIVGNFTSTIGAGTSVTFTAASILTITGNVTIGASTTFNGGSFALSVAGNWINNGIFNGNTGTITFSGAGKGISGSGTQNFNNLTVSASLFTFSNGSISLSGNLATISSGSFIQAAGGTLLMTGTSKTISGTGISIDNLSVSGTVTTAISFIITGNLSVSGSFTASAGTITMSGASKTISGAGTIGFAGLTVSGTVTAAVNFSISSGLTVSGSLSASAGTATFTGTSSLNGTANLFNTVINGTSLQLSSNSILGIAGVLTITSGILNVTSSVPNMVNYNGSGPQNINATTYNNLTLSNGNSKTAVGAMTVYNSLTIAAGTTFIPGAFTHSIYNHWNNYGSFAAGASTIQFLGTQTTNITGTTTFNILTINTTNADVNTILQSNVTASTVNMVMGSMHTGTNTLTITTTRTGNGIIMGNIERTHAFTTGIAYAFEGPDNTITFAAVSSVTSITVSVKEQIVNDFPFGGSISQLYNIVVPAGTYDATLRLHYEDDELNGNEEASMGLWNYDGSVWVAIGKTANDTTDNYIEQSGLTNITNRWTCSDNSNVVQWNGSISTNWNTAGNWSVLQGSASTPPSASDIVNLGNVAFTYHPTISNGVTVKNIIFGSAQAVTLSMAGGGSLTSGDINGNWNSNVTHTININDQSVIIDGDLILSDGTDGHAIDLNINAGILTVGDLEQTGGANIYFSGAGILNIAENFEYESGTFIAGTGTVNYNGEPDQEVAGVSYNDLTINKPGGLAAIDDSVDILGNLLVVSGELDNYSTITISGNVTIDPGSVFENNNSIYVAGNWNNNGTYIGTGSQVVFNGSGTQTISATTFNNLEFNKPAQSLARLTGDVTIKADLLGTSGTLDIGSYFFNRDVVGGSATMLDSATLIIGADNAPNKFASYSMSPKSTVIFNGTGAQHLLLPGMVYGNIIFRNTGTKTLYTPATVNGDLTIESGATFDGGSQTVTLNGNWINDGTFVPSASSLIFSGISKSITGNTAFSQAVFSGSYTAMSDVSFNNSFSITATGSFFAGSGRIITHHGDINNSGGVLNIAGTDIFTGTTLQTISAVNATIFVLNQVFDGFVSPVFNSTASPQFGNVTINNTGGLYPTAGWTILQSLTIGNGASFNGGNSAHIFRGNVTNNGTITSSGDLSFLPAIPVNINLGSNFSSTGNVEFGGAGALTLLGSPGSFHNVRITNSNASGITPVSDWTITNNFTVTSGSILNAGNHNYFVAGNVTNNGTLNSGTSTFSFNGVATQTVASMIFYNLVAMNSGGIVKLLNATVNNDLSVTTGTMSIGNSEIGRTIAVKGNITITSGTTLNVDSTSNATHLLTVSGNIVNNGTLNLRPDANSLCNTTFNKAGTQTISGTGSTTSFNNITVNMGVADTNHVDVTATNFSAPNGFLTLNNGSFNLNSAAVSVTPFITDIDTGKFLIPATAGLWVNAGTINSSNMRWTVAGSVKVTGGTLNMGDAIDNVTIPKNTGNFLVTAGNLNLASRIGNPGATWSYNMQGGTMTVNTKGSTVTGVAAFNMDATAAAFNMTGGTIVIRDAGGTAGQNLAYNNLSTTGTGFTGGTLQIGNILTTASQRFGIISTRSLYNLSVSSTNATAILQTPVLAVSNNVTITLGKLDIDSMTLQIGGAISNSGTFIASKGTIEMNGTAAQTIPAAVFQGNNLKGLTINNNAGVTLAGAINLTDVLTVTNGSLAAGGYLTLKSSATATARVAPITSVAGTPISGNVTAERYVPGRRKYRLITSPVTTSTSSTLTAGQETLSMWGNWQNSGINTTANVGELITGGSVADGFDPGTANASLYTYDDVNRVFKGYTSANGKNTKYTPLKAGIAYLMFVYGDRQNSVFATVPHTTVLNAFGTLKTGDQTYNTGSAIPLTGVTNRFTLLGNPFASPINWATISKTNLADTYWGWDPNLSSTGGYITVTNIGGVTIQAPYSGSTGLNQYIQSGQGFFVKTIGASPSLIIREQDKVSNFNANAYRGNLVANSIPLLAVNLQYVSSGTKVLADGVLTVFDAAFSNTAGVEDATKMANTAETISILNDTTLLSIDARKMPQNNDTLFLNVLRLTKPQYMLQIFAEEMVGTGVQAFLRDSYLNTTQPLSLSDTNNIVININTGIPASYNINRFKIVFQTSTVILPLKFLSITAAQKNKDIKVEWVVAEETGVKKYEIERSADGINFSKAGEVAARGNNTSESYNWLDVNPATGNNFYRVRAIDFDGKFLLSKIVMVKISGGNTDLKVFPNPVTDQQVNIRADEMAKGQYHLLLYNQQGQQMMQRKFDHTGGAFNQVIAFDNRLTGGIYNLQISGGEIKYNLKIIIQ